MTGTIILASEGVGDSEDGWAPARQVRAIETLWPLLGRHIAFHRRLVDLTASVKAAVLLSQSIYWTRHGRDIDEAGGWFLKTTGQWRMETGLSAREQDTARLVLRDLAIMALSVLGVNSPTRVQLEDEMLRQFAVLSAALPDGRDREALLQQAMLRAAEEYEAG